MKFGHHDDPVEDFSTEAYVIAFLIEEWKKLGDAGARENRASIEGRIFRAMQFRVGGSERAVEMKDFLRTLEAQLKAAVA